VKVRLTSFARRVRVSLFARQVSGLWAAQGVVLAMALVQAIVVARLLGPKAFGTAALIIGSTSLVFTFFDPQSQEAVVKYLGKHHERGNLQQAAAVPKVAYGVDVLLGIVGFAIVAGAAPFINDHLLHSSSATRLLVFFAAASAFAAPSTTSRAVLTTFQRFSTVAVLQAGAAVLRAFLAVVFVAGGLGASGFVYAVGIGIVVESISAGVFAHRAVRESIGCSWWQGRRSALGTEFREIVRFMIYTDLTSLVVVFVKEADTVVLGALRGPRQAGFYRLAKSVASPMSSIVLPLQQVVYPRLARLAALRDEDGMRRVARDYTVKVGLPIAAAALVALPLLPFAVPALAGSDYEPAVGAAMFLVAGAALILPLFWARSAILAGGHVRGLFLISVVISVMTLAGYFVLGDPFGASGVAAARAGIAGVTGSLVVTGYLLSKRGKLLERPEEQPLVLVLE
jgi:O-antigen/teichoic acid export membrane protein